MIEFIGCKEGKYFTFSEHYSEITLKKQLPVFIKQNKRFKMLPNNMNHQMSMRIKHLFIWFN